MELIMLFFAPVVGIFAGTVGISQALTSLLEKLQSGLDSVLDRIGLED